jgi:regulator of sirC expression with transglutaminase-like and TPR domain
MGHSNHALARLLTDEDAETVRLVKEQLASIAEDHPETIQDLMRSEDPLVSFHAKDIWDEMDQRLGEEDFTLLCHFAGDVFDIEKAAWSLSAAIQPSDCDAELEGMVNDWGREFLSRSACATSPLERVQILSQYLAQELQFRGNSEKYYCEENSLIPRVVESRVGIPISLTLVYQMIGARAGMKIEGINLPGHFIARHGEVYFDPFHEGRVLCQCDVKNILDRQGIALRRNHLQAANSRQFLLRILANLLYVYDLDGEIIKRDRIKGWMTALNGGILTR